MNNDLFQRMKRYVGFTSRDAEALQELAGPIGERLPAIIEDFYADVARDPIAAAIFTAQPDRPERLRQSLSAWLTALFSGIYDDAYFRRSHAVGRTHVRVELPQEYMFTGINVIRLAILREVRRLSPPDLDAKVEAVEKLLDLELGIMNRAYSDHLIERMQQLEQDRFERRLSESRHLAIVGELAASIAHEVKNPLAGISGAMQVIRGTLDDQHPHREVIDEALRQIDRLDAAIEDLLVYARPRLPERTPIDIAGLLRRVMIILQKQPAFENVEVDFETDAGGIEVEADEGQLQQVLMNVMINAAHACEGGGRIVCRIQATDVGARVEIEDNGIGIDDAIRERVWEPFFTTRARGTGLGLAICKRIIDAHDGSIQLASEPGCGTRVMIDLTAKPRRKATDENPATT